MTWSISKSGPREQVLAELENGPIPTHLERVEEQQHYSAGLDCIVDVLRRSTNPLCTVSASGSKDADGRCSMSISTLSTYDAAPASVGPSAS